MRRVLVLVAVLATLMAIPGVAGAASPGDFEGEWQAVDNDGSNMTMTLKVTGNTIRMKLFDDFASGCGDPPGGASANGFGTIEGDVLTVDFKLKCENGRRFTGLQIAFKYKSARDTITELRRGERNVTWTRVP